MGAQAQTRASDTQSIPVVPTDVRLYHGKFTRIVENAALKCKVISELLGTLSSSSCAIAASLSKAGRTMGGRECRERLGVAP